MSEQKPQVDLSVRDQSRAIFGVFDNLPEAELRERLSLWCKSKVNSPVERDDFDLYYNTVAPRSVFVKNAPSDACLLDMGAGNGSLSIYKSWPSIARPDIKFYGTSLDPIENEDRYEQISISNFETTPRPFGGVDFDVMVASHFIEHLTDVRSFIKWAASCLKPGGRIYLEWPHEFTKNMPPASFFADNGIPAFTTNFFDDSTHVQTWAMDDVISIAGASNLRPESTGRIVLPYCADQMRDFSRASGDKVLGTFAVWCAVGWAQYLILAKPL
ncbi:class I SAM-dependent methyltransferase [Methylorubrum extorquens]|uniref:class I SAM-dependent methyltransferase n=1 Tax=Methylorubrum extorquens TaxID=408 RepID=UPI00209D706F|nr:methyltransferase domain-containing protein [Methylorubrum extorquens]MCP1538102.1 SAM-dependent methyltransferase [Methylorubrum extorquens]